MRKTHYHIFKSEVIYSGKIFTKQILSFTYWNFIGDGLTANVYSGNLILKFDSTDSIELKIAVKVFKNPKECEYEFSVLRKLSQIESCPKTFIFDKKLKIIVMELCSGGDLYERIYLLKNPINECKVLEIVKWLTETVFKIHLKGIVHCDLKLENIGIIQTKLIERFIVLDFGKSIVIASEPVVCKKRAIGTYESAAPELLSGNFEDEIASISLMAVDMWLIGVIAVELCYRTRYENKNYKDFIAELKTIENISLQTFIQRALIADPLARITLKEAISILDAHSV